MSQLYKLKPDSSWEPFEIDVNLITYILARSFLRVSHVVDRANGFGVTPFDWVQKQPVKSFPFSVPWALILSCHCIALAEPGMHLIIRFPARLSHP
jgi:hypothetical protein